MIKMEYETNETGYGFYHIQQHGGPRQCVICNKKIIEGLVEYDLVDEMANPKGTYCVPCFEKEKSEERHILEAIKGAC